MIREIPSAYKGTVTTDIENIKGEVADAILHKLQEFDIPKAKEEKQSWTEHDADLRMLFGSKYISVNTKNIEYQEEYYVSDYVMCDKAKEALFYFDWSDLSITLIVYRLGQYSYWTAEVYYVLKDHSSSIR